MKLFYRKFGEGVPIIILHGLYGSSDNWITIGRALSEEFEVWLVDQRNHGKSPHNQVHTYQAMQEDLKELMDEHKINKAILIGHSMGGKTVMKFAIENPERVSHLIVLDIAPKSYLPWLEVESDSLNHKAIMESMLSVDFKGIKHRSELDEKLSKKIRSTRIRQFILKNVKRKEDKSFGWRLNIEALYENLHQIVDGFLITGQSIGEEITGFSVLFVKGGDSEYLTEEDKERIQDIFPYAEFKTIDGAGHWLHAEQPDELLKVLRGFID
ncbi:MAG: alpha/beta fold hydrolase [Chloroflexia bacterium]|nr:alpha/beta fold hydrolase [Chloroflexia bacterium]